MRISSRKLIAIGLFTVALPLLTHSAQAGPFGGFLPGLTNLDFSQTTNAPKGCFQCVDPTGWTGGGGLIYIDSPTLPDADAAGSVYLQTYGDPSPNLSGNYVEADGNPTYENSFSTLVTGLTPGDTYELIFDQAGSQQTGFGNGLNTTEQWIVSLGLDPLSICYNCGPSDSYYGGEDSTYYNNDSGASVVASAPIVTPSGSSSSPWEQVTMFLTADSTSDLLSFLAWGDDGNTVNLPPIVFLTGVDTPDADLPQAGSPEPESAALFSSALLALGLGMVIRRRRAARA